MSYLGTKIESIRQAQGWANVRIAERAIAIGTSTPATTVTSVAGGVSLIIGLHGQMSGAPNGTYTLANAVTQVFDKRNMNIAGPFTTAAGTSFYNLDSDMIIEFTGTFSIVMGAATGHTAHVRILDLTA